MARVFTGERVVLSLVVAPLERLVLRVLGVTGDGDRTWRQSARTLVEFSGLFWLFLYVVLRTQTLHPGNGKDLTSGTWDVTFNTVSSFVTNANWQFCCARAATLLREQVAEALCACLSLAAIASR